MIGRVRGFAIRAGGVAWRNDGQRRAFAAILPCLHVEEDGMNYALTIKDNIITGGHESLDENTADTFDGNPEFAGQTVTGLKDKAEYRERMDARCFDKKGKLKTLVWRIEQGYERLPDGAEIVDGVLVDEKTTVEEAPPTLVEEIRQLKEKLSMIECKAAKLDTMETDLAEMKRRANKQVEPIKIMEPIKAIKIPQKNTSK